MSDEPRRARPGERYARKAENEAARGRRLKAIEEMIDRLDGVLHREADVPLHQRGFGVMDEDEPPA